MPAKLLCFVISPIGEAGSEIRQNADDLLDLIIRPALEIYDFDVIRGDHRSEANQIDVDVIKCVQEAEICIADISLDNANVYYEVGRRDETGKPLILLRARSAGQLPVDMAARRYIEYDLDSRSGIRDARTQLRNFIQPLVDSGFERSRSSSLSDISAILQRVERKLDRLGSGGVSVRSDKPSAPPIEALPPQTNPTDAFRLALRQNNIPLMEAALDQLRVRVDRWKFLDMFASLAAARGSEKGGRITLENAREFIDNLEISFKKKIEYLGCLVSYLNRSDREIENLQMVREICAQLEQISNGEEPALVSEIYNQLNRLYFGIYLSSEEMSWLDMACHELEKAIAIHEEPSYYYNLALCRFQIRNEENVQAAKRAIDRMLELSEGGSKQDPDHLQLAYRIYRRLDDPRAQEYLEKLRAIDPVRAQLLEANGDDD